MSFDREKFIAAFDLFYAQALEVAEECDMLLDEREKIRSFADKVKQFAIDLRPMLEKGEPVGDNFQVNVSSEVYLRLKCNLSDIESALELTHPETVTTGVRPVSPRSVHYTPSLSKR